MASDVAEKIKISDLASPILSELQKSVLAQTAASPVTLSIDAVLAAARDKTGLSDFGAEDFRPRLAMWMQAANNDRDLSSAGRAGVFNEAVRYAVTRLYVENEFRAYPEIAEIEIDRPLVIAGLPRSGTTYLLQLLSADPNLRSLPHWEGVRPVARPYIVDGKDTRFDLCAAEWAQTDAVLPYIKAIHEFAPEHITEDIELQGVDFGGYYLEWMAMTPEWRDYQFSHDPTPVYRYMRKIMQLLTWQKGPNRWVTKCPQHMEQLLQVNAALPGAYTVINHRDPIASIQSAITGIAYGSRLSRARVDMKSIADYWVDRYERLLRNCVRDRDQLDPARAYDLYFHDLMADPLGQLERIYRGAGATFDAQTRAALQGAIDRHKRGKHGQLLYDLRGDFGLDPEKLRQRFSFYYDRFPVRIEVK